MATTSDAPFPDQAYSPERIDQVPASFAQQRLWFLDKLEPGNPAYNLLSGYRISGPLDTSALERALNQIIARHEALRTTFSDVDDEPMQIIHPRLELALPVEDLRGISEPEREAEAKRVAQERASHPFDLARGPLLAPMLFRLGRDEHAFFLAIHHIITDGWSMGVFFRELGVLYQALIRGETPDLPELPVQYADYALWQREWLQGDVLEEQASYWKAQLGGAPPHLNLPTDYPRPALQTYRGTRDTAWIPAELTEPLRALSRRHGATLFMTLMSGLCALLHRYTGQHDILVGIPIANRNHVEIENLIGFFVNTLILRANLSESSTFQDLLAQVRRTALSAYTHQDLPFEMLIEQLKPRRDPAYSPFFQVMMAFQNVPQAPLQFGGLSLQRIQVDTGASMFDLTLYVNEVPEGLRIQAEYNVDLFRRETILRMLEHFRTLLEGAVADPTQVVGDLPLLAESERRRMLVEWNATDALYPDQASIPALFAAQARRTPFSTALLYRGKPTTYQGLERRANQIAHLLVAKGVQTGSVVGVCLDRSPDLVAALLAVMRAGGAYLPLDAAYPAERLAFMLRDAAARTVLTNASLAGRCASSDTATICLDEDGDAIDRMPATAPQAHIRADDAAYVIYTSGSSGQPKGVVGLHRGAVNRFAWMWQAYPFDPDEVGGAKTSPGFVDSVWELFGPLLNGVPVALIPDDEARDPARLVDALAESGVTRLVLVPSLLRALLDGFPDLEQRLSRLRFWVSSGERLPVELCRRFHQRFPGATLLNLYGSSEVSADVTCYDTGLLPDGGDNVPIGRPIANTRVYLLDQGMHPVPVGVPGEICVSGHGLARGYLNRPDLTEERFIATPDGIPDPGRRLYRTGDLGRFLPDGDIAYLGRLDRQVKVRGVRVELGEVEVALSRHPSVGAAAVASRDEGQDQRLVAYVVPKDGECLSTDGLGRFLRRSLPDAMVPSSTIQIAELPLTPSGKVDYLALSELPDRVAGSAAPPAPLTSTELELAAIWSDLLRVDVVGPESDFWALGGHSLMVMRLLARIGSAIGARLSVLDVFEAPSLREMASRIEDMQMKALSAEELEGLLTLLREKGEAASARSPKPDLLVTIQEGHPKMPLFLIHGVGGGVTGYASLSRRLGRQQSIYALRAFGLHEGEARPDTTIGAMATRYLDALRAVQPAGPYYLGGYCYGGVVAYEMACQLAKAGERVALLAIVEGYAPSGERPKDPLRRFLAAWRGLRNLPLWLRDTALRGDGHMRARLLGGLKMALARARGQDASTSTAELEAVVGQAKEIPPAQQAVLAAHLDAVRDYRPEPYPGWVTLLRVGAMRLRRAGDPTYGWARLAKGGLEIRRIPGTHYNVLEEPAVKGLAAALRELLARGEEEPLPSDEP